jgi:hypothetical protein
MNFISPISSAEGISLYLAGKSPNRLLFFLSFSIQQHTQYSQKLISWHRALWVDHLRVAAAQKGPERKIVKNSKPGSKIENGLHK